MNQPSRSLSHAPPYLFSSYGGYESGGVDVLRLDSSGRTLDASNLDTSVQRIGSVYAAGSYVVANDRDRLYLIDITEINAPQIKHTYEVGGVNGLHGQNDLVVAATGAGLLIFRISEQEGLELVASMDHPSHCVQIEGPLLATGNHLIDVSSPTSPRLLSSMDLSMRITAVAIRDSRLFIAGSRGSYVYDISDPEHPEQIWTTFAELTFPSDDGDRFFALADGHLQVYSISPSNAFELSVAIPTGLRDIRNMVVRGGNLYLVQFDQYQYQSDLFVHDVSDIHNVSQVAFAHTSNFTTDIFVNDDYIVLADMNVCVFPNNLRDTDTAVLSRLTEPHAFQLSQNYPNPFNAGTAIPFSLHEGGRVELLVYNLAGQRVAQLESGFRQPGPHVIHWDGRDLTGRTVASGVYIFQLLHKESVLTRKMLLLK